MHIHNLKKNKLLLCTSMYFIIKLYNTIFLLNDIFAWFWLFHANIFNDAWLASLFIYAYKSFIIMLYYIILYFICILWLCIMFCFLLANFIIFFYAYITLFLFRLLVKKLIDIYRFCYTIFYILKCIYIYHILNTSTKIKSFLYTPKEYLWGNDFIIELACIVVLILYMCIPIKKKWNLNILNT